MHTPLSLDTLGIMHDEIRHRQQVGEMAIQVRAGVFWTAETLQSYARRHQAASPHPIAIAHFPDGRMMIRDGHHRCLATYIGGRGYLRHDEYKLEHYTYEMYAEINFEAGFITPFDPRTEVRVPDFTAFRQEVLRLYAHDPAEAEIFIRQNKARYARPHRCSTLPQLAAQLCQSALAEGVARGDLVADLALLGVSRYTIKLLATSQWQIVSLRALMDRTAHELMSIAELGKGGYHEIQRALQRYPELETLRVR
ncbi:MAG: hypothetical protein FJZ47_23955 [Candidatus Tectomicrobia bacterium]|uniref:ParB/Sulfiredoxin domain-containing protein n=1 Tax=Tectimicrobiota bacterium TaxID=2528274 RepID=A0A938B4U0_UNCTE|nr:hypothetical protein [Candidatus Tectomicrobia bacterium]